MIWLLMQWGLGCVGQSGATEAERFAMAADPGSSIDAALSGCQGMRETEARGDCISLALSTHRASTRETCAGIESERWRGECYFLLAEREREQDLVLATETCSLSSFARECMEHLVRSEASLVVDQDPLEQQSTIAVLASSPVCEDAGVLFWQEWALLRVEADLMVSRRDCRGLADEDSCAMGMRRARKTLVQAAGFQNRCQAAKEGRALLVLSDGRAVLDSGVPIKPAGGRCGP